MDSYTLVTDTEGFEGMVRALSDSPLVALDTETTGLDPLHGRLLMAQFGIPGHSWVVDLRKVPLALVGEYLCGKQFLFQNGKFDLKWLYHHTNVQDVKIAHDTMLAEQVLMCGLRSEVGLEALSIKYLKTEMEKATRLSFVGMRNEEFTEAQLRYAVRDVQALFPIIEQQQVLLQEAGLLATYKLERAVSQAVAAMELSGLLVDQVAWREMLAKAEPLKSQYGLEVNQALGGWTQLSMFSEPAPTINLNSPIQLLKAFRKQNIPLEDTTARTLELNKEYDAVAWLLKYRGQEKLLSAFGEKFLAKIDSSTGRVYASFNQCGTDTGRFSSNNPNMQQIPHDADIRASFLAAEGCNLVDSDYSGQELRILAHLSQDEALAEAFRAGKDVHAATASLMFGVPLADVKKDQRGAAKVLGFGLIYGRGPKATADQLKVSLEEAEGLISQYFSAYPGVSRWLRDRKQEVRSTWESRTVLGRRRLYRKPGVEDPDYQKKVSGIERRATNTPIQGTGADLIKLSLVYMYQHLPESARLVATVHDEILVECKAEDAESVKDTMEYWMRYAGKQLIPSVPVEVGSQIAPYWAH